MNTTGPIRTFCQGLLDSDISIVKNYTVIDKTGGKPALGECQRFKGTTNPSAFTFSDAELVLAVTWDRRGCIIDAEVPQVIHMQGYGLDSCVRTFYNALAVACKSFGPMRMVKTLVKLTINRFIVVDRG
jgi:hypothetical protein